MLRRQTDNDGNRLNRLQRAIMAARAALSWELIWPRLVPVLTVVGLFVALSWFGLWRILPDFARIGVLVLFGAALLYTLSRFFNLRFPDEPSAVHKVEVDSGLAHRPASGLRDSLSAVSDDPAAQALWAEHRKRQLAQMQRLHVDAPKPEMARRDPNAWRFAVPVLLVAGFFVAAGEHRLRLGEAFLSSAESAIIAAPPVRVDAQVSIVAFAPGNETVELGSGACYLFLGDPRPNAPQTADEADVVITGQEDESIGGDFLD